MRNQMIAIGLIVAAVLVIRGLVMRAEGGWEGIFERMPDTAPPKWMLNNIRAIRENTDKILERLEEEKAAGIP